MKRALLITAVVTIFAGCYPQPRPGALLIMDGDTCLSDTPPIAWGDEMFTGRQLARGIHGWKDIVSRMDNSGSIDASICYVYADTLASFYVMFQESPGPFDKEMEETCQIFHSLLSSPRRDIVASSVTVIWANPSLCSAVIVNDLQRLSTSSDKYINTFAKRCLKNFRNPNTAQTNDPQQPSGGDVLKATPQK